MLKLDFLERLRGERRFASREELIGQMESDVHRAREICG
jgi:FAD synthase